MSLNPLVKVYIENKRKNKDAKNRKKPSKNERKLIKLVFLLTFKGVSTPPIDINTTENTRNIMAVNTRMNQGLNKATWSVISKNLTIPCTRNVADKIINKIACI